MESVFFCSPEKHNEIRKMHPATFPVKLPAEYIKAMSDENDIVIEPFGGSGTTLIACEQLGRQCRIMELEPKYVDVIIKRWEDFTGQKAELIQGVD
jgi:DNA modification methylase